MQRRRIEGSDELAAAVARHPAAQAREDALREPLRAEEKNIRIVDLDLTGRNKDEVTDIIFRRIRRMGFRPEKLLYSGFDITYLGKLLETGTYSRRAGIVHCSDYEEITSSHPFDSSAIDYLEDYKKPGLVVYDPRFLRDGSSPWEFKVLEGTDPADLIKVVFRINW